LPFKLTAITRATVQFATSNLPNSEQMGGGGSGSARGYYADTAMGSEGVLASQEIRVPAFSPSSFSGVSFGDRVQFGAFSDYAHLAQVSPIPDLPRDVDLASAGVNAHYTVLRYLDVQFDLGWRLNPTPEQPRNGGFGQIAVTIGY
jgi:hemolysin activation/secretion protein